MKYRSKKDIALIAPLWSGLLLPFLLGQERRGNRWP